MDAGTLEISWKSLGILLAFIALIYFMRGNKQIERTPTLFFSTFKNLKVFPKSMKARGVFMPKFLEFLTLFFFLLAFADFRIFFPRDINSKDKPHAEPTEGIAIYLILDQSGSMREPSKTAFQGKPETKIQLLKRITRDFIQGNPNENLSGRLNDLFGLIVFARVPDLLSPLTLDHQFILKELDKINLVTDKTHDGTGIGYAIYKTANLIAATRHFAEDLPEDKKKVYDIKSTIMILITDGIQEINPSDEGNSLRTIDIPEAAAYAKQQGIRLYVVNIEPQFSTEQYAPFRHEIQKATESTGGKFFMMSTTLQLSNIYREIDRLEKSKLPGSEDLLSQAGQSISKDNLPHLFQRFPLYPFFIGLGLLSLFLSVFLKSTWMRQMP